MLKESFGRKRISSSEYTVEKYIFPGSLCVRPDSKKQQQNHKQKTTKNPQTKTHHGHQQQQNQHTHTKTNNNNNKIDSNMSHQMIMSSFTVDQIQPVLAFKSTPMFSLQMFISNRNASIFAAISVYASDRKCQIAEVQK